VYRRGMAVILRPGDWSRQGERGSQKVLAKPPAVAPSGGRSVDIARTRRSSLTNLHPVTLAEAATRLYRSEK